MVARKLGRSEAEKETLHVEAAALRNVLSDLLQQHDARTSWFADALWEKARSVLSSACGVSSG
jgi:hypothetical protein